MVEVEGMPVISCVARLQVQVLPLFKGKHTAPGHPYPASRHALYANFGYYFLEPPVPKHGFEPGATGLD